MIKTTKMKILNLFDGPTLCQLATVNREGRPWVRHVMSSLGQDMILRIPTKNGTRKVDDIKNCPYVHILSGKNLFSRLGAYVQIEGEASLTNDYEKRKEQWNSGMMRYFFGPSDPSYILIEVRPIRMEYWSALENRNPLTLEPEELEPIGFVYDSSWGSQENHWTES